MIDNVAALYVDRLGPYPKLVEHWYDETRDARTYAGPFPIIAHPPCGPWGRLRHMYKGNEHSLALLAVEQVRRWGGVLEHPRGSRLWLASFPQLPLPEPGATDDWGGFTIEVQQVFWGHVAQKRTRLYCVGVPRWITDVVPPFPNRSPTHHISRDVKRARRNAYTLKRTSSRQNRETPVAFAQWLVSLAATARRGAPVTERKILKCKFCTTWSRPLWWVGAKGKTRSGWAALVEHMADEHITELLEIRRRVRASTPQRRAVG